MSVIAQNKLVRNKIIELIKPVVPGGVELYAFKKTNIKTGRSVCVFFDDADVEMGAQVSTIGAELLVMIVTSAAVDVDDSLDEIGIIVDDVIDLNTGLDDLVELCQLSAWQYERENDSAYSALYLSYKIEF